MAQDSDHQFSHSYSQFERTRGTNHGDVWPGTVANDTYYGLGGTDTISGFKGNDRLHGGADSDILDGEEDNDRLFGDSGDDFLIGGYGNDVMTGGGGTDTFYELTDFSLGAHTDKITDFMASGKNHEVVNFTGYPHFIFNNLAQVKDHMTQHGDDVKFNFGVNNYLIFEHTHIRDFSMADFVF